MLTKVGEKEDGNKSNSNIRTRSSYWCLSIATTILIKKIINFCRGSFSLIILYILIFFYYNLGRNTSLYTLTEP